MRMQIKENFTAADVFRMSGPIFIELALQMLVGNVDQFMVSRISEEAVAAIGNGNQLMNIVIILLSVLAGATTVVLSQTIGAGDARQVRRVCGVSTLIAGIGGLIATLILTAGAGPIFRLLEVPSDVMASACGYTGIVGALVLVQGLYMNFAAILRSYGLVREVTMVSAVMNLCNIAGNAVLINGLLGMPRLGVIGAAISTDLSKCIGLAGAPDGAPAAWDPAAAGRPDSLRRWTGAPSAADRTALRRAGTVLQSLPDLDPADGQPDGNGRRRGKGFLRHAGQPVLSLFTGHLTGNPDCIGLSGGQRAASGDSSPCVDHRCGLLRDFGSGDRNPRSLFRTDL